MTQVPLDHHNAREKMEGGRWGEEKISGKELRFQLRAGESLLSLQVSHNMYQIQSVSNGRSSPRPQPRPAFAGLRVLALPPSGEGKTVTPEPLAPLPPGASTPASP